MAACNIVRDNNNNVMHTMAPNGARSILFDNLKSSLKYQKESLDLWLTSKTKGFVDGVMKPKSIKFRKKLVSTLKSINSGQPLNLVIAGKTKELNLSDSKFKVVKTPGLTTMRIELGGVSLGRIRFTEEDKTIFIDSSLLSVINRYDKGALKSLRGIGIGTKLYSGVIEYALKSNKTVISSSNLSPESMGVWDKLVNMGVAQQFGDTYIVRTLPAEFDSNGEPKIPILLDYVDRISEKEEQGEEHKSLGAPEVKDIMVGLAVDNASQLLTKLKQGFIPDGDFQPTRRSLFDSGLYNSEEITDILSDQELLETIRTFVYNLDAMEEEVLNDVYTDDTYLVVENGTKNRIGKFNLSNPYLVEKIAVETLGGIKTREEFETKVFEEETSVFLATPYMENKGTSKDLFIKFKQFKKLGVVAIEDGQLVSKPNNTREYLEQVLTEPESIKLQESLIFLISLDNGVYLEAPEAIRELTKDLTKELINIGLDVTSLESTIKSKSIPEFKEFLNSISNFLILEDAKSFDNLIGTYNEYFNVNTNFSFKNMVIPTHINESNTFYMESTKSNIELFKENNLIKVGDNIYKRVAEVSSDNMYESIYNSTVRGGYTNILPDAAVKPTGFDEDGTINLNKILAPENKEAIIADMKSYINKQMKDIYVGSFEVNQETLENYTLIYNFYNKSSDFNKYNLQPNKTIEQTNFTNEIGNINYLKTDFIADFNKKALKEKLKNSEIYNDFYKNFRISSIGITLINQDPITLNKMDKYLEDNVDLINYLKLHKQGVELTKIERKEIITDDLFLRNYYTNFPTVLPAYKGDYSSLSDNTLIAKTKDPFIRLNGGIYELVNGMGMQGIYGRLEVNEGIFKNYDTTMPPPLLDIEISEIASIDSNIEQDIKITHLYNEEEKTEINNKYDNC